MTLDNLHPEDVKAAIRKRYGTVKAFVKAHDLPETGVSDLFRGRTSAPVRRAVEQLLAEAGTIGMKRVRSRRAA